MNKKIAADYEKNGFVEIEGCIPDQDLTLMADTIHGISARYISLDVDDSKGGLDNRSFNEKLIRLRSTDRAKFSSFYDSCQSTVALKRLVSTDGILKSIEAILGVERHELSGTGETVRIDSPVDSDHLYDWHQERSYYANNRDGRNGIFFWIPLHDVKASMGPLVVAPTSHREQFYLPKREKLDGGSIQHYLPSEAVAKYQTISVEIRRGSALAINMHLFHKSGVNTSSGFRFSVIGRYHLATADDYLASRGPGQWNAYDIARFRRSGDPLLGLYE